MASSSTEKENVLISAGGCSITVLPQYGGKIASIVVEGKELLQTPLAAYGARTHLMPFDASDASGWDECLPSVAACEVTTAAGTAQVPDHGDLWRVAWKTTEQSEDSVTMRATCFSLPLDVERTATLVETQKGYRLSLDYLVTNTGGEVVPWSWAAHPLFSAEEGDRIVLPDSIIALRVEASRRNRLGRQGDTVSWPMATLADGSVVDLRVAQAADSGVGDKLFAGPLAVADGWCVLERPSVGLRIRVGFHPEMTPYLGLWICYGGWPEESNGPKQVCVAMEPTTSPVDSLAEKGAWSRNLTAGESFCWSMVVNIEEMERVKNLSPMGL